MSALFSPEYLTNLMNAIYYIVRDSDLRYFIYFLFLSCVIAIIKKLMVFRP